MSFIKASFSWIREFNLDFEVFEQNTGRTDPGSLPLGNGETRPFLLDYN